MIKFSLDNTEEYEKEFGKKFKIPPKNERTALKKFEDTSSDFAQVERMWVMVDEAKDGCFIGILDNEPFIKGSFEAGDLIKFDHTNVLEIYKD